MKRYRSKKAKPNSIRVSFGKVDGELDICYSWNGVCKTDARLMNNALASKRFRFNGYPDMDDSLLVELLKRGYDLRTLDFKCEKLDESDEEGKQINQYMLLYLGKAP